jgi:hypothetical protein
MTTQPLPDSMARRTTMPTMGMGVRPGVNLLETGQAKGPSTPPNMVGDNACHTRFSKEQNQANHMCAQEVHTYGRMRKYQKQCYYITYT